MRQTQTQLPTHPPSTNRAGQPWKNPNDTTCSIVDFPQPSFLELSAATANITDDQTGGTGIFTSPATAINPPSSLAAPHQQHPTQYDLPYGQSFGTTATSTANGNPLFLKHHTAPQNQQQSMLAYQQQQPPPQPQREFTAQTLPVKPKPPRKLPEVAVKKPRKPAVKDGKRKKRAKDCDSD